MIKILLFCFVAIFLQLFSGNIDISLIDIFNNQTMAYQIFWNIRVPNTILTFFAGANLSLSGLLFQSIFKNPLATPFTLGISNATILGVAIGVVYGIDSDSGLSFFGFGASFLSIIILLFGYRFIKSNATLLLFGIALGFLYSSILYLIYFKANSSAISEIFSFVFGDVRNATFFDAFSVFIASMILLVFSYTIKKPFKQLLISDQSAILKGVDVKRVIFFILFVISLVIGITISTTGVIGFVGLIVPHIIKNIFKKSSEKLFLLSFLGGGIFLSSCVFFANVLFLPTEVPIGVVTSFLGAVFFIYLLIVS